ncbi:LysR family transcriptional regulator [Agrobacterium sp. Ap1]|uniref:LysR substrate-binding domain-containing protein n=1 Tax=Agrobacterium sp. Ap1 TaxID=2815337 RepID=UPI001A8DD38B|nr:LysR substrate-binding domain-containing protein [Agrobacterium sp. Ap1]MBO0143956.1 LysR family transcriptional regulator [Agrobacterium sp. Ap1]
MLDRIPLEAFRVYDAACRFMNFSRAGRELHITQAAVSRRIQGLEAQLGAKLFTRRGRNLALTSEGERLAQRVRATLEYLEESLEPFRGGGFETISIAASGSVSHLWLAKRLKDFDNGNPPVSVRLLTTDTPSELASEANDLVILYSTGEHPRWNLTPLMKEVLVPVASPGFIQRNGLNPALIRPDEIARLDLIDYERFNAHWISFRQWFARLAIPPKARIAPRLSFSTYSLAVDAALRGEGITLGSTGLIADELASGTLIELGTHRLDTGYGYHLGTPRYRSLTPGAIRLHQHLLSGI